MTAEPNDSATPPRQGRRTAETIRTCAIRLFASNGFQATTQRQLAAAAGINVGSLYNHIESKDALLAEVMAGMMFDLLAEMERTLSVEGTPVERLTAGIELHVRFHAMRADEVFIGNSELRSLLPTARAQIVELRDAYEEMLESLVAAGVASGDFHTDDPKLVVYAIAAIGAHVASWYRPSGKQSLDTIASAYAGIVVRGLCGDGPRPGLLLPSAELARLVWPAGRGPDGEPPEGEPEADPTPGD